MKPIVSTNENLRWNFKWNFTLKWKNTLLSFLPINGIFSLKCACISSTILTCLPYIPVCFYKNKSQKVNYSSKCDYNTGHFVDFYYEKSDSSSKCACIWGTILTFMPNNPSCFYTKNSQKVHFSSNCTYITGHLLTFFPNNVIYSAKCASISRNILTLYANNPVYFCSKNSQIEFVRTNENKGNLLYKLNLSAQMEIKGIYNINWICPHKWKSREFTI